MCICSPYPTELNELVEQMITLPMVQEERKGYLARFTQIVYTHRHTAFLKESERRKELS